MRANVSVAQEKHRYRKGVDALTQALAAPFDLGLVRFKPAVVTGNRAMALAYVDARAIQDRLDEVLGVEGWQDDYEILTDGSVVCRLRLRLGEQWITKVDVGSPSEQPDGGDRLKAAFSDALKRAAVKFGIGRYLYRLPTQWVDYDPQRRQIVKPPALPAFAQPAGDLPGRSAARSQTSPLSAGHRLPADGTELRRRLTEYDAKMADQGLWPRGALVQHVAQAGQKAGHGTDFAAWTGPAIALAVEETKAFEARARGQAAEHKEVA